MIHISLLRAEEDDSNYILNWRNDPAVRNNFFNSGHVSPEEHERWYKKRLHDPDTAIYIARVGNERIGVIRFEKHTGGVMVSANVAPHLIGKGFGSELIRLGTERYFAETKQESPVIAKIKAGNIASQKAFQKAGYKKKSSDNAKISFAKKPEDMHICDKELCLVPLRKRHISAAYLKWLNDPDVTKYLETKKSTEKELRAHYQRILDNMNTVVFAIEARKKGLLRNTPKPSFPRKRESKNRDTRRQKFLDSPVKPENDSLEAFRNSPKKHIGNAKLEINWKHGYASFGIMIGDKKQWGKGYGERTARLIADYIFNRLNLYAVILGVYGNHTAAIKSYLKAGFHIKGRVQDMLNFEGKRVDKVFMGISRNEFKG